MEEIQNYKEEGFRKIYDENFNTVYRISLLYLKSTSEAEDLVQEVFIKLLNRDVDFNDKSHIKAWLITVTKNLCKDNIKNFWKSKRVDMEKLPELIDENEEGDLSFVLESLLLLPKKYKIILYLSYYEEYSIREISEILDLKESTIQTQLSRGRKLLEKKLRRREDV